MLGMFHECSRLCWSIFFCQAEPTRRKEIQGWFGDTEQTLTIVLLVNVLVSKSSFAPSRHAISIVSKLLVYLWVSILCGFLHVPFTNAEGCLSGKPTSRDTGVTRDTGGFPLNAP